MQFLKLVKGVMLALPIVAITACSSTKTNDIGSNTDVSSSASSTLTDPQLKTLETLQKQRNSTVYFDFDKYNIRSDFAALLDQHSAFLRANASISIVIEGHADERGTPEYNIALGERRANAVKSYLQSRGVAANQISIVSYGKEKPAVLGHSSEAHAKNRRAIIVY